jgi:hypothetical protein
MELITLINLQLSLTMKRKGIIMMKMIKEDSHKSLRDNQKKTMN